MEKYAIFHIDGGVGKNIIATAVVKSIKNQYPEHKLIIITAYPEVFINNPNIYRVYKFGQLPYFYDNYIKDRDSIILRMEPYHSGDYIYDKKHLSEIWCDIFNIPCVDTKPEIYLTSRELTFAQNVLKKDGPVLLIQPFGGAENQNYSYSWARDLPPNFAQELVNDLKPHFNKIFHIKRENQPELQNTIKITDNFRNLFCYILLADKIIGIDSFVQHAAAALNKKATVGWIANNPIVFGHKIHDNILPVGNKVFRHKIDSYLQESEWTGSRFYECPFDDFSNIFKKEDFIESILQNKNELLFDVNPQQIKF
jgi:hypothetical protein